MEPASMMAFWSITKILVSNRKLFSADKKSKISLVQFKAKTLFFLRRAQIINMRFTERWFKLMLRGVEGARRMRDHSGQ